jgi:predicted dehydrogenase
MNIKRIGLMGCGTVADYGHAPTIQTTEGISLHALFDPVPERLRYFADKFGVARAFTDEEEFFKSGIDAVAITSPAPFHCANVLSACRHGKDILCEKPLATNAGEGEQMIAAADDAKVMLFTGFDYRFSPVARQIHRMIRDGSIGAPRCLRLVYNWNLHGKWETDSTSRRTRNARRVARMKEGGPLVDCGVHQIDLARWWVGSEVVRWSSSGAWVDEFEVPDHLFLHLDHANGVHSMVEISFSYCHTAAEPVSVFTYEVIGSGGVIRYDRNRKLFEVRSEYGTTQLPFSGEKNFEGMYEAFARALITRLPGDLPTARDGLEATRLSREATEAVIHNRIERSVDI